MEHRWAARSRVDIIRIVPNAVQLHGKTLRPGISGYMHNAKVWMKMQTLEMRTNGIIILSRRDSSTMHTDCESA
jgi:hypothetical protein